MPQRARLQIPIETDNSYGKARIEDIDSEKLLKMLEIDDVLVVAGFQGVDAIGRITTLGRGGSDTSAWPCRGPQGRNVRNLHRRAGVFTTDPTSAPRPGRSTHLL
jgi:aspartate kinase